MSVSFFLLYLDAHNHIDDYSGTLGGDRKVHVNFQLWSQVLKIKLLHCLKFILSQKQQQQ